MFRVHALFSLPDMLPRIFSRNFFCFVSRSDTVLCVQPTLPASATVTVLCSALFSFFLEKRKWAVKIAVVCRRLSACQTCKLLGASQPYSPNSCCHSTTPVPKPAVPFPAPLTASLIRQRLFYLPLWLRLRGSRKPVLLSLFFLITYISAGLLKYFVCEVRDGVLSACYRLPKALQHALLLFGVPRACCGDRQFSSLSAVWLLIPS